MAQIKAIVFDVGGVLTSWSREATYEDLKDELGFNDKSVDEFWKNYVHPYGRGEVTETELWERASRELGIRQVSPKENLIGRTFVKTTKPYKEILEYACKLKERGFKIAILSNTNEVHTKYVEQIGAFKPFDYIFLSHEVGIRKPDPKIYKHLLEKLDAQPKVVLFIDDTPENIETAKKLGMRTILAKNPKQIINDIEAELGKDFIGTKLALINRDKILVILRDDKPGIDFPGLWDLPGGSSEKGETPMDTAIREIKEELNIDISPDEIVWQRFYPAAVNPKETASFMVVELTDKQVSSISLGDEGQEWGFIRFDEFLNHSKAVEAMKGRLRDYMHRNNQSTKPV